MNNFVRSRRGCLPLATGNDEVGAFTPRRGGLGCRRGVWGGGGGRCVAFGGGRSLIRVGEDGGGGALGGGIGGVAGIGGEPAMGVVGEVELWEAGVRVGVGGEVEAEVVAGVFVGVVVGGGMEVEGGVEEVVLGRVWHEVVGVELGGENACGEVVGVVADFIDVSVWKRARGDDERTVAAAVVRVGILGAEYGGVEAGAVLAGLWPVVDDHGGERRVDVAVGRGDHARTESIRPMLTSAYEIHLPLPYPAPPKIRRSTIIYLFYRPPPGRPRRTPPCLTAWSPAVRFGQSPFDHQPMLALFSSCCGLRHRPHVPVSALQPRSPR